MAENTSAAGSDANRNDEDEDDIRARFARLQEPPAEAAANDQLPPVPDIQFERPKPKPEGERRGFGVGTTLVGSSRDVKGSGIALSIGTNLVASIIVGTGLGWLADKYLLHSGATPWGLIVGFMLGVVAGFVGLVRAANQLNKD